MISVANSPYRLPYSEFFEFNDSYIKCVDEDAIEGGYIKWTDFYPHDAFINLLKKVIMVVDKKDSNHSSIRVEGAYGTGKSYAVLTIKKMLESDMSEVENYFKIHHIEDSDLLSDIRSLKQRRILIVYKEGSSGINSDMELINTIQNSVNAALKNHGYKTINESVQDSIVKWLSDPDNAAYFDKKLDQDNNRVEFKISSSKDVLASLSVSSDLNNALIKSVTEFALKNSIVISKMNDIDDLEKWLCNVIDDNELYSILFIWDEFTEFLNNNKTHLTGLQSLLMMKDPFNMMVVTHQGEALFNGIIKRDYEKLDHRFIKCEITLPDNMALRLIGSALKNKNPEHAEEWKEIHSLLKDKVHDCIFKMSENSGSSNSFSEEYLEDILPISPYAGLILKHISTTLQANQRSMFEFIKDDSEELHGFRYYIANHNFRSPDNLLTVDMLWDFFYNNTESLDEDVRSILSAYDVAKNNFTANPEHERVFKAILLMRAMSNKNRNSIEILKPTNSNLKLAFAGVKLGISDVESIAKLLVDKYKLLMVTNDLSGEPEYSLCISSNATQEIRETVEKQMLVTTMDDIIGDGENNRIIDGAFDFNNMYGRYIPIYVTTKDFKNKFDRAKAYSDCRIRVLIALYLDDDDREKLLKMIHDANFDNCSNVVIIDLPDVAFTRQSLHSYLEARAWQAFYQNKDKEASKTQSTNRENLVSDWVRKIKASNPDLYDVDGKSSFTTFAALKAHLLNYSIHLYPLSLDTLKIDRELFYVTKNKYNNSVKMGVTQNIERTMFASKNVIENALKGIWNSKNNYWEDSSLADNTIVKIKKAIIQKAEECLDKDNCIPLETIKDMLYSQPFGFLPCDFSALMVGFLLKEYAAEGFVITNSTTPIPDSQEALINAISETLNDHTSRYRQWLIQPQTVNLSNFYEVSASIFRFNKCLGIDATVDYIRNAMRNLKYPYWSLRYLDIDRDSLHLIDLFTQIVKDQSSEKMNLAELIGKSCTDQIASNLKNITTTEDCKHGMLKYINQYASDKSATDVINVKIKNFDILKELQSRGSSTGDSSWVWNEESWNQCMDRIIDELKIINVISKYEPNINFKNKENVIRDLLSSAKMPIDAVCSIHPEYSDLMNLLDSYSSSSVESDCINKLLQHIDGVDGLVSILSDKLSLYVSYFPELSKYDDSVINEIIQDVPSNRVLLYMNRSDFSSLVKISISKIDNNLELKKLKKIWFDKTGSESTSDWSQKRLTPISCVIDADALFKLKGTIDRPSRDSELIEEAKEILLDSNVIDKLNDVEYIDNCFRINVLGQYSCVFNDLSEARSKLHKMNPNPESWINSHKIIEEIAKDEYESHGRSNVLKLIDSMNPEDLKLFLKDKVQSNMTLGMELLSKKE